MKGAPMTANLSSNRRKGYRGIGMEGFLARWYARTTAKNMGSYQEGAQQVAAQVPSGGSVLEVAPGPGYLTIELAKLGGYRVVGLDISASFVRMATENAQKAGVMVEFRQGNASAMPFTADEFDFIVCRAAFKNFSEPVQALREMHRVLKPGGRALILDMRSNAPREAIAAEVKRMNLGTINSLITKWTLHSLLKRAYSQQQFRDMVAETPFGTCEIREEGIGMAITFVK
jgi:ubiquinone/menaquinone biosynthesis C-methylase UbiE